MAVVLLVGLWAGRLLPLQAQEQTQATLPELAAARQGVPAGDGPPQPGLDFKSAENQTATPPLLRRWWFWAAAAGVVAATLVVIVESSRAPALPATDLGNQVFHP